MSVNLVDRVMGHVGGNLPGVIGSLIGESAGRTEQALDAAVPAIFAGLMGVASEGGTCADQLVAAVRRRDDDLPDHLAGKLGAGGFAALVDQGDAMLSSIFGAGVASSLVAAVGRYSGLGNGSTKSLLGLLMPVVTSVLGREQTARGAEGGSLVEMLMDQKDHVAQAMPAGLATALVGAGLLNGLGGSAAPDRMSAQNGVEPGAAATEAESATPPSAEEARADEPAGDDRSGDGRHLPSQAAHAGTIRASWLRWVLPLIILLGLIWLAVTYLGGDRAEDQVSAAGAAATHAAGNVEGGWSEGPAQSGIIVLGENIWLCSSGADSIGPAAISPI